jgi:hypothetical protein
VEDWAPAQEDNKDNDGEVKSRPTTETFDILAVDLIPLSPLVPRSRSYTDGGGVDGVVFLRGGMGRRYPRLAFGGLDHLPLSLVTRPRLDRTAAV